MYFNDACSQLQNNVKFMGRPIEFVRTIIIHSLVQHKTTTVVFDRSECKNIIF